jgi:hypothetical protein
MEKVDVSDEVWGIYQDIGRNGSEIIHNTKEREEFVKKLREVADKLETTLIGK